MLPSCPAPCSQFQAPERCHMNSSEPFACWNASAPLFFGGRGGRSCRSVPAWCRAHRAGNKCCFCVTEVANVTTAVDIYSFGMCALEVSVEHRLWDRVDESEGRDSSGKAFSGPACARLMEVLVAVDVSLTYLVGAALSLQSVGPSPGNGSCCLGVFSERNCQKEPAQGTLNMCCIFH